MKKDMVVEISQKGLPLSEAMLRMQNISLYFAACYSIDFRCSFVN